MSRLSFWPRITLYYLTALVTTGILFGVQVVTGIPGEYLQLPQIGPALAAVIFIALEGSEVKSLFLKGFKFALDRYTITVIIQAVVLIAAVSFITTKLWGIENFNTSYRGFIGFCFAVSTVIAALCEEIGWRGYLLPRLQSRMAPAKASLILGILWGLWHIPKLMIGAGYFSIWFIGIIGLTFVLTYVFNDTKGNIWSVTLIHSVVNLMASFFLIGVATDLRVTSAVSAMFLIWAVWVGLESKRRKGRVETDTTIEM